MNILGTFHWRGLAGLVPRTSATAKAGRRSAGSTAKHARASSGARAAGPLDGKPVPRGSVVDVLGAPFRLVARLLFSAVRIEREGKHLNVKLETKPPEAVEPAPLAKALAETLAAQTALKALLDSHAKTRRLMRHLTYFERSLAVHGSKALAIVPVEVLSAALGQLESLVGDWSDPALAELRSKMAVALIDRSVDELAGSIPERLSNFNTDSRLVVDEVSHSVFLELDRQYQDRRAPPLIMDVVEPIRVELPAGAAASAEGRPS